MAAEEDEEEIGMDEKEFLDNVSWDTSSDENEFYNDLNNCQMYSLPKTKKKPEQTKRFEPDNEAG